MRQNSDSNRQQSQGEKEESKGKADAIPLAFAQM